MPGPSRYRPNGPGKARGGRGGAKSGTPSSRSIQLAPPLHDHAYIVSQFGQGVALKPQWNENPKAPLANFLGNGRGGAEMSAAYTAEKGSVEGTQVYRVSVVAEPERNIIGVGDHANKKEAEKLSALSAVLQLAAAGILEKRQSAVPPLRNAAQLSNPAQPPPAATSSDTAKLSDGSEISYDRARQFMDYYCQVFKFGKPDIEYSQTSSRGGRKGKALSMTWDAVMSVGQKKIGMGQAGNKKGALVKAYLDVTQYLESCDPGLWKDFVEYSKKDKSANIGMAPHLVFQMSDDLNEVIQGLCADIRHSRLWENAPATGATANENHPPPVWGSGRDRPLNQRELEDKSLELQDRLAAYETDPNLEKMRKQRAALPVTTKATEVLAKIHVNDVTIVMAATGSGKTTQVPQLIFDDYINRGQGAKCNIVCTQPRRLAAMSVAERIADERGQNLGKEIGYQVRFDVKLPEPNGSVTFCTTGIFLKRMQSALGATADPNAVRRMDEVTHIVVDEVHERDIDTDLLLVVLKRLLADRKARQKPLKIILMSATIDPSLFQTYFADSRGRLAPVAEIPGRTFPVERFHLDNIVPQLQGLPMNRGGWVFNEKNVVEYLSNELSRDPNNFGPGSGMALEIPYPLVALTIADVMKRSEDGHVLVFLPGWEEIKKVADILLDSRQRPLMGLNFNDANRFSIHYLHSTIPAAEQKEVFRPPPEGVRRVILATNIAETSITIPDVVYVVDTARVKEKRYDPERHMSSLVSAWVGSSNLNQRAGRAGRHREGEYYGLLSKNRLAALDPHQMVEMKRSDLSNVVMHVKALNLGKVEEVLAATIEPPEPNRIVAAMEVLRMLGALDANQNLTSLGRVLLQLPVEAAIGKLCLYGSFFRCLDSALTLAAVLTNRDPFLAPIALKAEADRIKDSWSPLAFRSDPLAIVAAYDEWSAMDDRGEYRAANAFCSDNFLSKPTMLQIKQVKGSLLQSLDQAGVIAVSAGGAVDRIGRRLTVPPVLNEHGKSLPLLAALIAMASAPNFALRTSEKTCRTSQDKTVFIHASSVNSRRREAGGPEEASASFNPAEKRLYAFGEKSRNVPLGGKETGGITQIRSVTRLDPMTYMLFGAYELVVTQRGLECDQWLPVVGNLYALDDVQRLKQLLDGCMLRVFEGVGKSLTRGRDQRWRAARAHVDVRNGSSRIREGGVPGEGDEGENESDDEDDGVDGVDPSSSSHAKTRVAEPLSMDEIKELELLTTDVVKILDDYAAEREGGSVVNSRPVTPGLVPSGPRHGGRGYGGYGNRNGNGNGHGQGHGGAFGGGPGGAGVYRPPQISQYQSGKW
ncbi:nuclear DNA helicase II [Kwoniella heveanensis CBS 569]|nr:nuclear DNA helicase II [Kwoniella heveanensis CBS 569]